MGQRAVVVAFLVGIAFGGGGGYLLGHSAGSGQASMLCRILGTQPLTWRVECDRGNLAYCDDADVYESVCSSPF